jgi:hypothetical protein
LEEKLIKNQDIIKEYSEKILEQKIFIINLESSLKEVSGKVDLVHQERSKLNLELNEFKIEHDIKIEALKVEVINKYLLKLKIFNIK